MAVASQPEVAAGLIQPILTRMPESDRFQFGNVLQSGQMHRFAESETGDGNTRAGAAAEDTGAVAADGSARASNLNGTSLRTCSQAARFSVEANCSLLRQSYSDLASVTVMMSRSGFSSMIHVTLISLLSSCRFLMS